MIRAKVNDRHSFLIEKIKDRYLINGENDGFDIQEIDGSSFHIIHDHKSYQVTVLDNDLKKKLLQIKVNGSTYKVALQDKNDLLLQNVGILKKKNREVKIFKAPMPGLIIEIKVKEGQSVKIDDPLLILKAMKMENILKSPINGVIRKILVTKNQKIEKEAAIIQF